MAFVLVPSLITAQADSLIQALGELGIESQRTDQGDYRLSSGNTTVFLSGVPAPFMSEENVAFTHQLFSLMEETTLFTPRNIRLSLNRQDSRAVVLLEQLFIEDKNILQYLPGGLTFVFDGALFYDFNMVINELRLRIRGQYFSAEELFERLSRIANSPEEYLLSQDSEYVMRYLRGLRADQELILSQLSEGNERLLALDQRQDELTTRQDGFDNRQDDFDEHLAKTDASAANIYDQLIQLRYGVMLLNSRGFFGSMNEIAREEVMTVVQWKQQNPQMTRKDIEARLKAEGMELSGKQLWLTLILFFNQWE